MRYLVECDDVIEPCAMHLTAGTFETFNYAEAARRIMEETTGLKWTVWYIEFHYDGVAEGDRTSGDPTP